MAKVFIDGAAGTTGLEIRERLADRDEFSLVQLSDAKRKDMSARTAALNEADVVILCLPDEAARDAVGLIENSHVRVIDASSAHRVAPDWVYGFPELEPGQRAKIASAARVSNPGCWPTGFLALVRPLVRAGIVPPDFPLTVTGVSGYSGGGKAMIEEFEAKEFAALCRDGGADLRTDIGAQTCAGNARAFRTRPFTRVLAECRTLLSRPDRGSAAPAVGASRKAECLRSLSRDRERLSSRETDRIWTM